MPKCYVCKTEKPTLYSITRNVESVALCSFCYKTLEFATLKREANKQKIWVDERGPSSK